MRVSFQLDSSVSSFDSVAYEYVTIWPSARAVASYCINELHNYRENTERIQLTMPESESESESR
jgi:hypothetical protein